MVMEAIVLEEDLQDPYNLEVCDLHYVGCCIQYDLGNSQEEDDGQNCPRGEIKKLKIELWNLKVKGNDVGSYIQHFHELALICTKFVYNKKEKVDKYIGGLLDNIHGNVMSARPKTPNETIELANDLMDQNLRTYVERQTENKRRADDASRNNHGQQQQPNKRHNVARAYTAGPDEKKAYTRNQPLCTKCNYHHNRQCAPKCNSCKKYGHATHEWNFKINCPKLKNNGNPNGNDGTRGKVYVLGGGDSNLKSNNVMGAFHLNNRYASILFDTGADKSFVSTAFSALINIAPTTLDNHYDVKLVDGKTIEVNTILRGCTLEFKSSIQYRPHAVPLGSFDVIIGMDWLREYHAVIVCDEKIVRVPFENETLIFQGKRNDQKEAEDKLKEKRLEDVPIVRDFPEVFSQDILGIPPTQQVEFQIDLVPGAAPVAWVPYQLAPSEMKEIADQLQELYDKGFIRPSSSP
nr:hypothetical protein [Tanacetum cinerariifolium]